MDTKNFKIFDKVIARARLKKVIDYISMDDVVLDFGCGSNSFLLNSCKLKIKFGVGLDYDVKSRKEENIEYIKYKFNGKLPFKDKSFDKVFMLAVLEHIEVDKVNKLFLEFKRILKKGGKIILTTPTPMNKVLLEFLAYRLKIISAAEIKDHKKYYNDDDIGTLAKESDLKLENYNLFQLGLNSCAIYKKNN